jgi:hypothetical protein
VTPDRNSRSTSPCEILAYMGHNMRLFGVLVSEVNCRILISELLADESPQALNLAERLSAALARKEPVAPLVPGERDALLRHIPKKPPSGLVALRDALKSDQLARE